MSPPVLCRAGRLDPLERRTVSRFVARHGSRLQFSLAQDGGHLAFFHLRGRALCLKWSGKQVVIQAEGGGDVVQAADVASALEALLQAN